MSAAAENSMSPALVEDTFLSAIFDARCCLAPAPVDLQSLSAELSAANAPVFVWTKLSNDDDPALIDFEAMGFRVAVEEITYERPNDALAPIGMPAAEGFTILNLGLDNATGEEALALNIGNLAADALTTSRFHQDPSISSEIAAKVKRKWAMNFFSGNRGQQMIVALDPDGRVVGFNQVLINGDTKTIDLICVAESSRRKGVARALVEAMFTPIHNIRVGSQANNSTADRFYRSIGFEPVSNSMCLHWHKNTDEESTS